MWSVIATLLWSIGLSDIATNAQTSNVLTVLSYTLVFAGALLMTPLMVHALAGAGFSAMLSTMGPIGMGPVALTTPKIAPHWYRAETSKVMYNVGHTGAKKLTEKNFPKVHEVVKKMPRFNVPKRTPIFEPRKKKGDKQIMKLTVAWSKVLSENSLLRWLSCLLAVNSIVLVVALVFSTQRPPLVIDRGCSSQIVAAKTQPPRSRGSRICGRGYITAL